MIARLVIDFSHACHDGDKAGWGLMGSSKGTDGQISCQWYQIIHVKRLLLHPPNPAQILLGGKPSPSELRNPIVGWQGKYNIRCKTTLAFISVDGHQL